MSPPARPGRRRPPGCQGRAPAQQSARQSVCAGLPRLARAPNPPGVRLQLSRSAGVTALQHRPGRGPTRAPKVSAAGAQMPTARRSCSQAAVLPPRGAHQQGAHQGRKRSSHSPKLGKNNAASHHRGPPLEQKQHQGLRRTSAQT
ncbi:hypothetical protein NDU88_004388 [Pleurodeles waltl]|uniref:Uncharacterized protein n=1 Tax=Pleurodeles waltl TaxID=8319 RepID=A0AAV7W7C4_PLEWA|nr:hypothetical protein NDU88_004388 [Pleurodeles waltl]